VVGSRAVRWGLAVLLATLAGCGAGGGETSLELSGEAFGTTWSVRIPSDAAGAAEGLAPEIVAVLDSVDAQMSTWRDDSELSRFNASRSTDWFPVSPATARVAALALEVHRRSQGAFDPTVGPLVALWGFGPAPPRARPPRDAEVRAALARVGAAEVTARPDPPGLRKARPELSLDLSGVAKGFAVDAVAARLEALGIPRFLVEVGGELRGRGTGPGGRAWRVGIERPVPEATRIGWTVRLADAALATSGDYRQFFEWRGRRLSHVIDPRSGRPVEHGLDAVSVIAPSAARADAWATALLVLGPEAGPRVAEREGLAALFASERDGALETHATADFERLRDD
jgi:thiamine biosynthesis lipoprotein